MSQPRVSSYNLLSVGEDKWEDVVWYMDSLQDLHNDIQNLENELHGVSLGYSGFSCHQEVDRIDKQYQEYLLELKAARAGLLESEPTQFSRWDGDWNSNETREGFDMTRGELLKEIERIETTSERVGQIILSKRNAANTRMVVMLSLLAVILSVVSLFVSAG